MSNESICLRDDNGAGIPKKCVCGGSIVIFTSTTEKNPCRQFFRCENFKKPNYEHLFKWLDETVLEELESIREEQKRQFHELKDLIEEVSKKSEMERKMIVKKICDHQTKIGELKETITKGLLVTIVVVGVVAFKRYVLV